MPVDLSKLKLVGEPTIKTLSAAQMKAIEAVGLENERSRPRWPSTKDKELILEAAREKKRKVTLENGNVFTIRYSHGFWNKKHTSQKEPETYFFLNPSKGFVPCGWFSIESLEKELL